MESQILLHFVKFGIQTHSLDIQRWMDRLYASNDLTQFFSSKTADLRLCVESKDSPYALPIAPPRNGIFAETNLCNARCFYEEGRFFSANHSEYWHEIEYDPNNHTIRASLGGEYLRSEHTIVRNIIRPILQSFILPFYGLKTLHGAVLNKDGRTVFLSGCGGMGKSTTTIQLMRAGYDVLSDDGPFFCYYNGKAYALSSLDYLHVTENTLCLFPELRPHVVGGKDHRDKFAVSRLALQQSKAWTMPLQITDFVRLQRAPVAAARLKRGDRSSAWRDLFNETMIIFRRSPLRGQPLFQAYSEYIFDLVAHVIQDAQVHHLEFADHHLAELPALLDHL